MCLMSAIKLSDFDVVHCNNIHCCSPEHVKQIDTLYNLLNVCLTHASIDCFSNSKMINSSGKQQRKAMPEWSEYVEEAHIAAKDAFCLWRSHNCPKFGPVFDLFKKAMQDNV